MAKPKGYQITDETVTAADLGPDSVTNNELASTAISDQTEKNPAVNGDFVLISDSAGQGALKKVQVGNLGIGGGGDSDMIEDADHNTKIEVEANANENKIRLTTNGAERMIIDDSGEVGIGTSSPQRDLHVNNSTGAEIWVSREDLTISTNDSLGTVSFVGTENGSTFAEGAHIIGAASENWNVGSAEGAYLMFCTKESGNAGDPPERMRIDDDGKVGIGTTSPGANLHIAGEDPRVRIDGDIDSHPGLELSENGTRKWIVYNDYTNDNLSFKSDATRMSIKQGGNVGIGTTDPQATLHVMGATPNFRVQDSDTNYTFTVDGTVANGMRWHFGGVNDEDAFMSMGAYEGLNKLDTSIRDFHLFGSNTTTGFYFDEDEGMFGIATSTPGSTLDINGSVSLKVNGLKTSDYTIAADDHTVIADCGSGNVTLTLPSATAAIAGRTYVIKRTDTSNHGVNTLTIDRNGSNIDGAAVDKTMANLDALVLQCVGQVGWILIGSYMAPPPP